MRGCHGGRGCTGVTIIFGRNVGSLESVGKGRSLGSGLSRCISCVGGLKAGLSVGGYDLCCVSIGPVGKKRGKDAGGHGYRSIQVFGDNLTNRLKDRCRCVSICDCLVQAKCNAMSGAKSNASSNIRCAPGACGEVFAFYLGGVEGARGCFGVRSIND